MVAVTVQLLKPVDEMKLDLVEIRGNRVTLEWTQVADVTGARPLDQGGFQLVSYKLYNIIKFTSICKPV